jgi:hypothetical protein
VAGLVGRHLPRLGGCPDTAEPVPQIQRVTDQPGCGAVGDPQHTAEFGGCEVGDGGGAVPAQPHRVLGAGQPSSLPRRLRVESAWGAVRWSPGVCFPRPLSEPGVRLSPHRALHEVMPMG